MRYADVRLDVTSQVRYHDGHFEEGPSTTIASRAHSIEALKSVLNLVQATVDDFHRTRFGASFRRAFFQSFRPLNSDEKWNIKLDITYHIVGNVTDDEGVVHFEVDYEITRPF